MDVSVRIDPVAEGLDDADRARSQPWLTQGRSHELADGLPDGPSAKPSAPGDGGRQGPVVGLDLTHSAPPATGAVQQVPRSESAVAVEKRPGVLDVGGLDGPDHVHARREQLARRTERRDPTHVT